MAGPSADRESAAWSRLREYYQNPNTPRAHDVLLAAVGISAGELLLVRGIDDGNWELPEESVCGAGATYPAGFSDR